MFEEVRESIRQYEKACKALNEGLKTAESILEKDGVVKRFEFTFELLWKTLKRILIESGVEAQTPRDCLEEAFKIGLITPEKLFFNMLKDRNLMAHCYDEDEAGQVFGRIRKKYASALTFTLKKLQNWRPRKHHRKG